MEYVVQKIKIVTFCRPQYFSFFGIAYHLHFILNYHTRHKASLAVDFYYQQVAYHRLFDPVSICC